MSWWAGSTSVEQANTAARLAAVERKLQAIMDHLGIADIEPSHSEVMELVRRGQKIAAIKLYREQTGLGLAAAKQDVERMAGQDSQGGQG
jgi:ribosomal protein L7/L12